MYFVYWVADLNFEMKMSNLAVQNFGCTLFPTKSVYVTWINEDDVLNIYSLSGGPESSIFLKCTMFVLF